MVEKRRFTMKHFRMKRERARQKSTNIANTRAHTHERIRTQTYKYMYGATGNLSIARWHLLSTIVQKGTSGRPIRTKYEIHAYLSNKYISEDYIHFNPSPSCDLRLIFFVVFSFYFRKNSYKDMSEMDPRPACKYGVNCYQRNELHLNRFSHPPKIDDPDEAPERTVESTHDDGHNYKKRGSESSSPDETAATSPKKFKYLRPNTCLHTSRSKSKSRSPSPAKRGIGDDTNSAATFRIHHGPDQKHDVDYIKKSFDGYTEYSQRIEYQKLLATPDRFIREKFLVEMPGDFYRFWDFCKAQCKAEQRPEQILEKFGLQLVGPFDVLAGKFEGADLFEPGDYLRHWRYFYDPPEFQTVFRKDNTGIHYGYWRDNPDKNCLIARNDAVKNCEFDFVSDNMFGAVM